MQSRYAISIDFFDLAALRETMTSLSMRKPFGRRGSDTRLPAGPRWKQTYVPVLARGILQRTYEGKIS